MPAPKDNDIHVAPSREDEKEATVEIKEDKTIGLRVGKQYLRLNPVNLITQTISDTGMNSASLY